MKGEKTSRPCIIGYGNPFRRDDGIGAFVAQGLRSMLCPETRVLTFHQLDPVVLEDLQDSDLVVFVDATVERLGNGMRWRRVRPETPGLGHTTHHFKPSWLLSLLCSLHHRAPESWLVSVQGDDFAHGEGLTEETRVRAVQACRKIAGFISAKTG